MRPPQRLSAFVTSTAMPSVVVAAWGGWLSVPGPQAAVGRRRAPRTTVQRKVLPHLGVRRLPRWPTTPSRPACTAWSPRPQCLAARTSLPRTLVFPATALLLGRLGRGLLLLRAAPPPRTPLMWAVAHGAVFLGPGSQRTTTRPSARSGRACFRPRSALEGGALKALRRAREPAAAHRRARARDSDDSDDEPPSVRGRAGDAAASGRRRAALRVARHRRVYRMSRRPDKCSAAGPREVSSDDDDFDADAATHEERRK